MDFLRTAREVAKRPFDIMLEAKGKDLALLRLRSQIEHFAPELREPDLRPKPACEFDAARV
ncbi:MAG: hypothetical protein IPK16_11885 [Anaerolineales bacterium]|nr:hypothetical protein [Anaerolineales bacterium]